MLVATAAVSLIAPIAAQASDFNIEGINSYVRKKSSSKKQKQFNSNSFNNELLTLEDKVQVTDAQFIEYEAGTFSDTTIMNGTVSFQTGEVNDSAINDENTAT